MLPPVRCFTCNKVIGHMYDAVAARSDAHGRAAECDRLAVHRYCCRRMLLTSVDLSEDISSFETSDSGEKTNIVFRVVQSETARLPAV